jgi:hypothetical protein
LGLRPQVIELVARYSGRPDAAKWLLRHSELLRPLDPLVAQMVQEEARLLDPHLIVRRRRYQHERERIRITGRKAA